MSVEVEFFEAGVISRIKLDPHPPRNSVIIQAEYNFPKIFHRLLCIPRRSCTWVINETGKNKPDKNEIGNNEPDKVVVLHAHEYLPGTWSWFPDLSFWGPFCLRSLVPLRIVGGELWYEETLRGVGTRCYYDFLTGRSLCIRISATET